MTKNGHMSLLHKEVGSTTPIPVSHVSAVSECKASMVEKEKHKLPCWTHKNYSGGSSGVSGGSGNWSNFACH